MSLRVISSMNSEQLIYQNGILEFKRALNPASRMKFLTNNYMTVFIAPSQFDEGIWFCSCRRFVLLKLFSLLCVAKTVYARERRSGQQM